MDLHLLKNRQPLKKLKNGEHVPCAIESKVDCKKPQIELARAHAIAHINLIYDALAAISGTAATNVTPPADEHGSSGAAVKCEQIDVALRDGLSEVLEDVSWLLSTCSYPPADLLRIQAKFLLELSEEPNDTPFGALAYSIASAVTDAAEGASRGNQKPRSSSGLLQQAPSIKLKSDS